MCRTKRTKEEYVKRYARDYCNGNVEEARQHKIVIEACMRLQDGEPERGTHELGRQGA